MPWRRREEVGQLRVESLSVELLSIVYPLVSAAYPAVEMEQWRQYALTVIESPPARRGLLGLRSNEAYFCGLLIYRIDREPWREPRLAVELFVAVDLVNAGAVTDALLAAAEATAASLDCTAVHIQSEQPPDLARGIRRAGYRPAGAVLVKQIGAQTRIN